MPHDDWEQHYQREQHDHSRDAPWSSAELAGFLAGLASFPQRALDIGCGTGADAVFLAERGITTIGIDISEAVLDHARLRSERHGAPVTWLQGDVLQIPLDDMCIDLVLDRGCLHHIAPTDQGRYMTEVARVLRRGGTFLVREMNQPGHHKHAVTEAALREMVMDTTLHVQSIITYNASNGDRTTQTMLAVFERE